MRRSARRPALALAFAVTLAAAPRAQHPTQADPHGAPAATADPCIATVGDRQVLLSELIDEVDRQIPLNYYHRRVPPEQMATFRRDAFDKLVVKHLVHLDALARGITASNDELEAEFAAALREAGPEYTGLGEEPRKALFAEVHPTLERRVLIRKNEERVHNGVPRPDEAMMRSLYDDRVRADPSAFMTPREAHFYQIFVAVDPARIRQDEEQQRAKIEAALAEIRAGKPFATVARIYSEDEFAAQGGDLGMQQAGSFRMQPVGDAAFALGPGETSAVIRSLHGFHLLYCAEEKPPVRRSFAEMRSAIEQWLLDEHGKLARGRWLADLRVTYPVTLLRADLVEPPAAGATKPDDRGR